MSFPGIKEVPACVRGTDLIEEADVEASLFASPSQSKDFMGRLVKQQDNVLSLLPLATRVRKVKTENCGIAVLLGGFPEAGLTAVRGSGVISDQVDPPPQTNEEQEDTELALGKWSPHLVLLKQNSKNIQTAC